MNIENTLSELVESHPEWSHADGVLSAQFSFDSFESVKLFVNHVISVAEVLNHHPEVTFGYNQVVVSTTTHDAGNTVTDVDVQLAKYVSKTE